MIKRAPRAIAFEFADIDLAREPKLFELFVEFGAMLIVHLLFNAIGAKARDVPARIKLGLIERVAEGFADIAEDGERARLRP